MDYKQMIKDVMSEKGITYAKMAEEMGMSRQTLWITLNGKKMNNPKAAVGSKHVAFETVEKMCKLLGMEVVIVRR